jgi:hypothetical protein
MKKTKKAQIVSQLFIYILAIFVFAVIVLYGYSAIKGFMQRGEETAFIQFKNTLESEVAGISTEPGDIIVFNEKNPLTIAGDYMAVCFVDSRAEAGAFIPQWISNETKQIISSAISANVHKSTENVFLEPPSQSPIYLGIIQTYPDKVLCINITNSRLDIRIEGLGNGAGISQAGAP